MDILVTRMKESPVADGPMEIVERKGAGHPDTLCDGAAEALSIALCKHYIERFGRILHHNVDKVALVGGATKVGFGGGKLTSPMQLIFIGRATDRFGKERIPVRQIAIDTGREFMRNALPDMDLEKHLKIDVKLKPGSADLVTNYDRADLPASNDTSLGVGYAPFTESEIVVLKTEKFLNGPRMAKKHPEWGRDIKIMGTRVKNHLNLTVALAFVAKHVPDMDFYVKSRAAAVEEIRKFAQRLTTLDVDVEVNRADVDETESVYLTVTGTSAEAGDDGQVGRGNRPNGIITPYRPMTLEAAAGKNPTTHVGKIYNLAAWDIADKLSKHEGIEHVNIYLVSAIGAPVNEPRALEIRAKTKMKLGELQEIGQDAAAKVLKSMPMLWKRLLNGKHSVC
jgi:S-adenosylmethionine synthetase